MRTIYSLQEFYDDVAALAAQKGTHYVSVKIDMSYSSGIQFSCYFDGCKKYYSGKTPADAIARLREEMFPKPPEKNQVDVEIEVEKMDEPAC